jgi:hypothetical protein
MTGIILQLQQTATDAGIEFDSIQPGGPALGSGYTTVPISLTFNGNYYGLTDFLYRLRNLVFVRGGALDAKGRLFSVESLDFGAGATGFPQIQAKIQVNAYVYGALPVPGQGSAPATPAPATTGTTSTSTSTTSTDSSSTPPVASGAVQ